MATTTKVKSVDLKMGMVLAGAEIGLNETTTWRLGSFETNGLWYVTSTENSEWMESFAPDETVDYTVIGFQEFAEESE